MEGLVLTAVAVVLAPFLSMGVVALAGKLPYFSEITAGRMLPVEFQWLPFVVAAGTGLLALAIFVVPRVVGARTGLVVHKLRSSRPPSIPLFHRYYLDVGLMVVGGLIFWELQAKGQLVSGGLFEDVKVNEALLLAPVLFLTVVALLFLRFFPLFVRFISGESPSLLNLVAAATFVSLGAIVVVGEIRDQGGAGWLGPLVLLAAAAGAYWLTSRATRPRPRLLGLVVQSGLVATFAVIQPPVSGENALVPTISLICLVPAQGLFLLLRSSAQFAPVWVTVGLWHMARNPLQYSWLVLLLVMVTGLGLLATTVGGTLDRSHEQRILYDVAADVRVSNMEPFSGVSREGLRDRFLAVPGVTAASLMFRASGRLGATGGGRGFDLLAVEPQEFPYMSWWRDDFASQPVEGVMRALYPGARTEPLVIPEGATEVGVWIKPDEAYANIFMWIVVEDSRKIVETLSVGELGEPDWNLMRAEIPSRLEPPLQVLAVQLWEPGFGPTGTPGSLVFDELHAVGPNGDVHVLDGFEGRIDWASTPTSVISTDIVAPSDDAFRDRGAVRFTFGKETNRGIRGISHIAASGPVPIAVSTAFSRRTGYDVGDVAIFDVMDRLFPVVVRAKVNLFPTMNPGGLGFVVADLDTLMRHLNILSPEARIVPNEALIDEAPGADGAVRESLLNLPAGVSVRDRDTALESVRLDPLVTAGWRAMVVLAIGIILFTAASGYFTYMLAFANRSRAEMGFLRSLGLSRRQMSALLILEHAVIVVMGLALGTWSGLEMSVRMVSSVAVTDRGEAVLPPFSLVTDWAFMIPIYVAILTIFGIALYALNRSMRRVDLQAIARSEG
ncbi:MAG: ABC transporter permease [Chloroflexi bacterium]|nr:ABC transporter permease [Chloroflexota bacterium]